MTNQDFANQLISWYQHHKRDLPWRNTQDPYKIWLSEVILQQTRVNQGMPYYLKFVKQYPTVYDLAEATEDEVLRLWQGLGYYSRARNLHACAKMVVTYHNGEFPINYDELLKLKGVGKYTAAAIASFSFGLTHAVLDGNVFRVLSRVFGIKDDIASTQGAKKFEQLANDLIDPTQPGEYNQSIMEFGAIHCTPKNPACALCPISSECYAFNNGVQTELPVKLKKVKVRTRYLNYLLLKSGQHIYMKQRGAGDVWQGLYDFALYESNRQVETEELMETFSKKFLQNVVLENRSKIFKHVLSHQRIFATFYQFEVKDDKAIEALDPPENLKSYSIEEIKELPKPILINNFLDAFIF